MCITLSWHNQVKNIDRIIHVYGQNLGFPQQFELPLYWPWPDARRTLHNNMHVIGL